MRATWVPVVSLLTACSSAAPVPSGNPIDDYIASLPYLPVDAAAVDEGDAVGAAAPTATTRAPRRTSRRPASTTAIVAYAANSDSLYPGAIVSADSVLTGLFTQIVLPRAPETISVSLENLGGTKQATIAAPSLSSYRDALSSILDAEITGSTPANLYSEIEQVHSENQLNMALGVQASWGLGVASLKTSFDFSNTQTRSRYVVRYTQAYYTVDLDAPASAERAARARRHARRRQGARWTQQHPPVYVSSVTYGRMVLFTFESQYSAEEMAAALDFAYSGGVDVTGDVSVTYKDMISQSKITAFILGGDAGTAVQTIDSYDALIDVHQDRRQLLARVARRADRVQAVLPEGQLAGADVVHHRLRRQGLRARLAEGPGHAARASRSTAPAATRRATSSSTARSRRGHRALPDAVRQGQRPLRADPRGPAVRQRQRRSPRP